MHHSAFDETSDHDGEFDIRDRVNVVILYDRPDAGRRAMNQLRKVNDQLPEGLDLQVRLWRLEAVLHPTAAATARGDLATADLLVLALDDDGSLNTKVCERLQELVHQMRGQDAAVAVLANNDAATMPSRFDFLHHAAEEAGLGFLFPSASRGRAGTASDFAAIHGRAITMTPAPEGKSKDLQSRLRWDHRAGSL